MTGGQAGLDWAGLMRAGLQGLRLHPDQFWALTPAELALMLGIGPASPRMDRERLADLAARYPDAPAAADASLAEPTGEHRDDDT
ncbi:rcc01693 family protein [Paracoccus hibiscisoli]|uniref:Phage tail assembly chaperone n=1 Tax=Paracoccus hibiscisoli TaxID=2023261 RepID=A0A4U0RCR3_9RHOB|nr:rcc01693 family protein [Paracoccus hibiscisoli]TJZ85934.1 phage tail assembly chaperone [Paracoccus hibiscisoli]